MLRMEQVHVIRHKVLREGQSVRQVARELGVSRNTIGKYLRQAEPVRTRRARAARVGAGQAAAGRAGGGVGAAHDGQAAADGYAAATAVGGRGLCDWHDPDTAVFTRTAAPA